MKIKLDKDKYQIDCGGIPVTQPPTEDQLLDRNKRCKRRRRLITVIIVLLVLFASLAFTAFQMAANYTAGSNYEMGVSCCQTIWREAEKISETEVLTLPDSITPESPIGQKILNTIGGYGGKVKDFRVCCKKGSIYMVVCNMYGRKLEESDIRFHTKSEQIQSLKSVFTKRKTVACLTEADWRLNDDN
ncbi:MAG: hypothetical protein K6B74_10805 [Ruminococcus sp.]|nr:hypothetical protein [Ruminococcus sp.]